ncbi:MAG: T9SS type A sorting domain-containing protein [Bacteroidales bacterium]|nr:T9SS type A sorting domain-containing protein [Bacteroidales bacterium]
MKRTFNFLILAMAVLGVQAQQYFIQENFSGTWPPSGWTISAQAGNWAAVSTSNAGGTAPEARLNWSPQFTGETRLITPSVDVSSSGASLLVFSFKHMVDNYSGNYQIGVSARTKLGPWTNLWTQTVSGNIAAQTRTIEITDADLLNSDELQFSLFFNGNSYNINYWYIDDVSLVSPADFDLAITNISVPTHFMGEKAVTGSVTSNGLQAINSFDLNWQVDDGEVFTQNFSGLNLGLFQSYQFTTNSTIDLGPGTYTLHVFVSNINGEEEDDVAENDHASKLIHIPHQEIQRLPLFESFTSSTCAPCATFNLGTFNGFTQQNQGELALIKYQMNWPGNGDPYYTAEGGTRRVYYGVSGVPDLFADGKRVATNSTAVNNAFQAAKATPSFMAIDGFYTAEGNNIMIDANIMPYADFPEARVHVVVIEGTTTGNVGSNGETSFKHVMMKMLPGANGTAASLNALEPYHITHTFNMSATFVEEMEDLKVVVFVQNHSTKEMYQAGYLRTPSVPVAAFSIEDGATNVSLNPVIHIDFDQAVRHADQTEITTENIGSLLQMHETDENGTAIPFTAEINEEKTQISIEPVEKLDGDLLVYLGLGAVSDYSPWPFNSEPTAITFTTLSTVSTDDLHIPGLAVYPNPASNLINVRLPGETSAEMRILDMRGALLVSKAGSGQSFQMDVSALPAGIYFFEVVTPAGRSMKKISIVR